MTIVPLIRSSGSLVPFLFAVDDVSRERRSSSPRTAIVVADKEKKEIYSSSYKLDATTNPSSITMTSRVESSAGEIARGLIQKEGDIVRLIYCLSDRRNPDRVQDQGKAIDVRHEENGLTASTHDRRINGPRSLADCG